MSRSPRNCSREKLQQRKRMRDRRRRPRAWRQRLRRDDGVPPDAPVSRSVRECIRADWRWSKTCRTTTKSCFVACEGYWQQCKHPFCFCYNRLSHRGHAGTRKDGQDAGVSSREASPSEKMAGSAADHPKGERNRSAVRGPVLQPPTIDPYPQLCCAKDPRRKPLHRTQGLPVIRPALDRNRMQFPPSGLPGPE